MYATYKTFRNAKLQNYIDDETMIKKLRCNTIDVCYEKLDRINIYLEVEKIVSKLIKPGAQI